MPSFLWKSAHKPMMGVKECFSERNGAAMHSRSVDDVAFASMPEQHLNNTAIGIAENMDKTWTQKLQSIPFGDFVSRARFPRSFVKSISDFENWDSCKEQDVYKFLEKRGRDAVVLYRNVEILLEDRNPHAHDVAHRALRRISKECYYGANDPCNKTLDLSFVVRPIREVFYNWQGDQTSLDLYLQMLEVRFCRRLQYAVDWKTPLSIKRPIFDLISGNNAWIVALTLTRDDLRAFGESGVWNIITKDTNLVELYRRWDTLYEEFHECALPDAGLLDILCEVAQLLYQSCNYFSCTALIGGLSAAGFNDRISTHLLALKSDSGYLAQFTKHPGLPFLFTHAKQFASGRKRKLRLHLAEIDQLINEPAYGSALERDLNGEDFSTSGTTDFVKSEPQPLDTLTAMKYEINDSCSWHTPLRCSTSSDQRHSGWRCYFCF